MDMLRTIFWIHIDINIVHNFHFTKPDVINHRALQELWSKQFYSRPVSEHRPYSPKLIKICK